MADQPHQWTEDVGRCVCCWSWCPNCRRCKCQARTLKVTGTCDRRSVPVDTAATAVRYERTGDLAALLPSMSACKRGSTTIHAAEDRVAHYADLGGWSRRYPDFVALCGVHGWGEAGSGSRSADDVMDLASVNCPRCMRTARFREATA